jgi:hypothetical protein
MPAVYRKTVESHNATVLSDVIEKPIAEVAAKVAAFDGV